MTVYLKIPVVVVCCPGLDYVWPSHLPGKILVLRRLVRGCLGILLCVRQKEIDGHATQARLDIAPGRNLYNYFPSRAKRGTYHTKLTLCTVVSFAHIKFRSSVNSFRIHRQCPPDKHVNRAIGHNFSVHFVDWLTRQGGQTDRRLAVRERDLLQRRTIWVGFVLWWWWAINYFDICHFSQGNQ